MPDIRLRHPQGRDDAALGQLMFEAIHQGASSYTVAERMAWLAVPNSGPDWSARLAAQRVFVAEEDDRLVGVLTLQESYIDLAYVAPDQQGKGVLRQLYAVLERDALGLGHRRLWTHASLMAQPAFLALGFHVTQHEEVARKGQVLRRAEMEKVLS